MSERAAEGVRAGVGEGVRELVLVVAHPDPASFTQAMAAEVAAVASAQGVAVRLHDLYADGFDPRMPAEEIGTTAFADELTARYAAEVLAADAIAVVHPVWFFHAPAIVKGWVDRVLREGVVYRVGEGGATVGLLRARAALVLTGANSAPAVESALGDPLDAFWRRVVFGFGGVAEVARLRFAKVAGSSAGERERWLAQVRGAASELVRDPP